MVKGTSPHPVVAPSPGGVPPFPGMPHSPRVPSMLGSPEALGRVVQGTVAAGTGAEAEQGPP